MKRTNKRFLLGKMAIFMVASAMSLAPLAGGAEKVVTAGAEETPQEIVCHDGEIVYGTDVFNGQGTHTSATYTIDCDEMVLVAGSYHMSAPSYSSINSDMHNYCGAIAGRNVVGFYDRWYTNLIPNYTPGMVTGSGIYRYYPDMNVTATHTVVEDLYDLMQIGEIGGTTSSNFRSGLSAYFSGKGYSTSYSSFYSSATSVNFTQLTNAINQNKVGVIMCTQYNFVYALNQYVDEEYVLVSKVNSTTAHMMMIFGYQTWAFYKDGNHVCTKTFLSVCSGFADADIGYMELNDSSATINEAVIISIS